MTDTLLRIQNILNLDKFIQKSSEYNHLFEVQIPPNDINLWKVRFHFEMGTPMVGDLLLDLEQENKLEIHPFPEWVVQLKSRDFVESKPYLIVPNVSKQLVKKINRKPIQEKIDIIKSIVKELKIGDLLAFEYEIGINVLIPAYIPHFFISSKIKKKANEAPPYLQVFEPNITNLSKLLNIKPTYYFELPFTVII